MNCLLWNNNRILVRCRKITDTFKRYRYKPRWAINTGDKTPCDHALTFFDKYYPAAFGLEWPSIRLALLSLSKYCALINNFSLNANDTTYFEDLGAYDILKQAHLISSKYSIVSETENKPDDANCQHLTSKMESVHNIKQPIEEENTYIQEMLHSERNRTAQDDDLFMFMPVKKVVSDREVKKNLEETQNLYSPNKDFQVNTISIWRPLLPSHLHAFTFDRGCIEGFKPAKRDSGGLLSYYLMDAASLLPVLALDLSPDCSVLDMCAAPGGKTVAMLETLLPGSLTCIDNSHGRLSRLKEVLSLYIPKSYMTHRKVNVLHGCAIHFCHESKGKLAYDRVLVDVPCFADRHALHNEENNMFRPSRLDERLQIQTTQRDLLVAGLLACKPGGSVVYSTCTLSMAQNDGVVRQALEQVWLTSNVNIAIVNTAPLVQLFADVFTFRQCQFGQLVIPNVTANFGPMYFCKLQRLN